MILGFSGQAEKPSTTPICNTTHFKLYSKWEFRKVGELVMLQKIVRPDAKGRITLGSLAKNVSGYRITETNDHKLILEPYVEIPAYEKWLFDNKTALGQVKQGIADATQGRLQDKGSFAKFIDKDSN